METMENKAQQEMQSNYQATQISTATKEQLLLITYDIGIRSCQIAEGALENKDYELSHRELVRAQNVIRELMVTLNVERGGDVAENLMRLYDFMHRYLVQANIDKDAGKIATVTGMLKELRQTWEEALLKLLEEYRTDNLVPSDATDMRNVKIVAEKKAMPTPAIRPAVTTHQPARSVNLAG